MTSDSCQSRKDTLSWRLKIHIFLEWQSANRRLFSNPSLTRSLLGPPHHGRRPRHRPARQDLRLLDLLRWAELFSLPYHFFVSFRLRPHHVLLKEKKKKKHSQSPVFPQAVWWEGHLSTYHSQSGKGINPSLHVYGHKMCQWRAASTSSDAEVFLSSRCHHQYNCCDRCLLTAGKWR